MPAEDVVDEEQHVLALHVPEVLGMVSADSPTLSRTPGVRLVHLAKDQRLVDDPDSSHLEEGRFLPGHSPPRTRTLGNCSIPGGSSPGYRLTGPGAAEHPDLAPGVQLEQVDHLDPGDEDLLLRLDLVERGRWRWIGRRSSTWIESAGTSSGSPQTLKMWPRVT